MTDEEWSLVSNEPGITDATVSDFLLPALLGMSGKVKKAALIKGLDKKLASAAQRYAGNTPLPKATLDFSDSARRSYKTLGGDDGMSYLIDALGSIYK